VQSTGARLSPAGAVAPGLVPVFGSEFPAANARVLMARHQSRHIMGFRNDNGQGVGALTVEAQTVAGDGTVKQAASLIARRQDSWFCGFLGFLAL
jgi:hypothetical protein